MSRLYRLASFSFPLALIMLVICQALILSPIMIVEKVVPMFSVDRVKIEVYRNGQLIYEEITHNIVTNAGLNHTLQQFVNPNATQIVKYIALSTDSASPSATDTSLAGEITSGGLERSAGTITVINETAYEVEHTFTATASFTGVQKSGLFAVPYGDPNDRLLFEALFSAVNLESGDQIKITWTINFKSG